MTFSDPTKKKLCNRLFHNSRLNRKTCCNLFQPIQEPWKMNFKSSRLDRKHLIFSNPARSSGKRFPRALGWAVKTSSNFACPARSSKNPQFQAKLEIFLNFYGPARNFGTMCFQSPTAKKNLVIFSGPTKNPGKGLPTFPGWFVKTCCKLLQRSNNSGK